MRRGIRFTLFVLIFACLLGTDYARFTPLAWEWLQQWRDVVVSACNSRDVQQVELVCLCVYLLAFTLRLRQLERSSPRPGVATWAWNAENIKTACMIGLCVTTLMAFFFGPPSTRGTTDPIVLFWGLVVGKGVRLLKMSQKDAQKANQVHEDILKALLAVIAVSVLVQPSWWQGFQYHGQNRWQGLWWNPNTFGMLMALGLVLALGLGWLEFASKRGPQRRNESRARSLWVAIYVVSVSLAAAGLVKSYSRGAWVGAAGGLAFLLWNWIKTRAHRTGNPHPQPLSHPMGEGSVELSPLSQGHLIRAPSTFSPSNAEKGVSGGEGESPSSISWFGKNWLSASVILASVLVLALWSFRDAEFLVARRAFSVANVNDLSWRNRLVAYEGGLQMIATRPWFGFGWDQPKTVYEEFYMPTKLTDGRAIELNDYFMIGLTLGLPAVACFVGYLLLSVFPPWQNDAEKMPDAPVGVRTVAATERWLVKVCSAGVIVLLVGFWLQRGLFWLALTVPFWVLLEIGRREVVAPSLNRSRRYEN